MESPTSFQVCWVCNPVTIYWLRSKSASVVLEPTKQVYPYDSEHSEKEKRYDKDVDELYDGI